MGLVDATILTRIKFLSTIISFVAISHLARITDRLGRLGLPRDDSSLSVEHSPEAGNANPLRCLKYSRSPEGLRAG